MKRVLTLVLSTATLLIATAGAQAGGHGHGGGHGGHHGGSGGMHGGFAPQVRPIQHAPIMSSPRARMLDMSSHRPWNAQRHWRHYPSAFYWPAPVHSYRINHSWNTCSDLKRKAYATGKRYWLKRYESCRAHG